MAATGPLNWPAAGRMCDGSFTKPWNNRPKRPAGSCGKSNTSTGWKPACGNNGPAPDCAQAVRAHQSRPIVERLQRALLRLKSSGRHLPAEPVGHRHGLCPGPMANAGSLSGRRPGGDRQQPGRKRHPPHGPGQEKLALRRRSRAGDRGAILYTLIESCRRRGIDPYAYLKDVLTRLPT